MSQVTFLILTLLTILLFIIHVKGNVLVPNKLEDVETTNVTTLTILEKEIIDSRSLFKLKDFIFGNVLGEGKEITATGSMVKFLESKLYSMMTSTGAIRATEFLETMKTKLLDHIQLNAADVVKSRDGYGGYGNHHHGGGIGFPSLEGALLSLAFLTFAVFLIDLIQQLISRYRTGNTAPLLGRRKRNILEVEPTFHNEFSTLTSKVFTAIEKPLFYNSLK